MVCNIKLVAAVPTWLAEDCKALLTEEHIWELNSGSCTDSSITKVHKQRNKCVTKTAAEKEFYIFFFLCKSSKFS